MQKYKVTVNKKKYEIVVKEFTQEKALLEVNGKAFDVTLEAMETGGSGPRKLQSSRPLPATPTRAGVPPVSAAGGKGAVIAPIPGAILEIKVRQGDKVSAGQPVLKMEAMKMENEISAPVSGIISNINVNVGDSVGQGQELMSISEG